MRVAVDQHHVGLLPNLYGPGLVLDTQGRLAASLVETSRTAFGLIPASTISYISRTNNPWPAWEPPAPVPVPVAIFTASIERGAGLIKVGVNGQRPNGEYYGTMGCLYLQTKNSVVVPPCGIFQPVLRPLTPWRAALPQLLSPFWAHSRPLS